MRDVTKSVVGALAGFFAGLPLAVQSLLVLMLLDVASGLCKAAALRKLSSDVSYRGMMKKVMILILVAASAHLGRVLGVELAALIAGAFCVYEVISIAENAAAVGLPIPKQLRELLEKAGADLSTQ